MEEKNNVAAAAEEINLIAYDTAPKLDDQKLSPTDAKDATDNLEEQIPPKKEEHQEQVIKKKYGGLLPKKHPLISKDSERAFFDSADWALGKAGSQKSKGPLEALRPKLQPTTHQHVRSRSAYAPADGGEEDDAIVDQDENENLCLRRDYSTESHNNHPENQTQQN